MKLKVLLLMVLTVIAFHKMHAQQQPKFTASYLAGLLTGGSEPAFQLQAIHGVNYREYSAGIGVGMDNYYFKSIPVFLHVTRRVFSKINSPFVYSDIGFNIPENKLANHNSWETNEFSKGLYFDLGFGYSVPLFKKLQMTFSLGYSQKQQKEKRTFKYYSDYLLPTNFEPAAEYYSYMFRRISLKAGLSF